jgi:RNA polymerase sigma factor (sigma-70 family)
MGRGECGGLDSQPLRNEPNRHPHLIDSAEEWAMLLHSEHWGRLVHAASRWASTDRANAEDLASSLLLWILEERFEGRVALPIAATEAVAFGFGVLRNLGRNASRRAAREAAAVARSGSKLSVEAVEVRLGTAESAALQDALSRLTAREREVVMLHWAQELSMADTCAELGIARNTGKELLRRARKKLRSKIEHAFE